MRAINLVSEFLRDHLDWSDNQIMFGINADVAHEMDPGPRVHRALNPIIRAEIKKTRKMFEQALAYPYQVIDGEGMHPATEKEMKRLMPEGVEPLLKTESSEGGA